MNEAIVKLGVFGGPFLALVTGFILTMPRYRQLPYRWGIIASSVMPLASLLILEFGGYFARGFSIIPLLPLLPALFIPGQALLKLYQQHSITGKTPVFLLEVFITWSAIMVLFTMDTCFAGACA